MAAVSLMTFGLVGCGSESPQSADAAEQGKNVESVELNGTIKLAGSTSMEKLCEAMAESFMERNPGVTVTVEYTGSGAGLESLAAGSVDIGNASRGLKDEEKASGVVENIVAIDGIAVITNKSCSIKDVTSKNLAKKYPTLGDLAVATKEELSQIDDIGSVMAASIYEYFGNNKNIELIKKMLLLGVDPKPIYEENVNLFEGMTFVLTGSF